MTGLDGEGKHQSPLWHHSTNDIQEVQEVAVSYGWDIQYTQHGRGPLGGSFSVVELPGLTLTREVYRAGTVFCFSKPKSFTAFGFPMRFTEVDRLNGMPIAAGDIISHGHVGEAAWALPRGSDMITLELQPEASRDLAELVGYGELHDLLRVGSQRLPGAPERRKPIRGFLASLLQDDMWPPSAGANRAEALAATTLEGLAAVLTDSRPTDLQSRSLRRSVWVHHARQARTYLEANVDRAVSLAELCRVSGTSARTIQYAFRDQYGVTPQAYHRARRLSAVHQILKRRWPGETTVTDAAFAHGFWHLGRFSEAYKAQFGESPSDTLARRPTPGTARVAPSR